MKQFIEIKQVSSFSLTLVVLLQITLFINCSMGIAPLIGIRNQKEIAKSYEEEKSEEGINNPVVHFPGLPQKKLEELENRDTKNPYKMSNFLYYGGYSSLFITASGLALYQFTNSAYQNLSPTPPFLYYSVSESTNGLGFLLMAQERVKFSSAYSRVESSAGIVNGGIGLFGLFVLFSNLNIMYLNNKDDSQAKMDKFPLYRLEKGAFGLNARTNYPLSHPQLNRGQEMQYTFEYNYQF